MTCFTCARLKANMPAKGGAGGRRVRGVSTTTTLPCALSLSLSPEPINHRANYNLAHNFAGTQKTFMSRIKQRKNVNHI